MQDSAAPVETQHDSHATPRASKRARQGDVHVGHASRLSRACATCRKLKVKCDEGTGSCTRCRRLNLTCLRETRSWAGAAGEEEPTRMATHLTITKLERALEDVLERLNMPNLDLYVSPAIAEQRHPPRATRPNSEEPDTARDVSPGPLNSLMEATQLNGIRSQLRSAKQRRKGGMRRRDHDLVSSGVISEQEAVELLNVFHKTQSQHLFSASIPLDATVASLRASSTVLFTAIILVTAFHIPGKEALHQTCHSVMLGLVSSVMFDRFHSLDDIRGLCIAAFWQPYLSWKLSGLSIRMATELNLHHALYEAFIDPSMTDEKRKESLEKVRLWYLLYVLDHQSSVTYGRPPVTSEMRAARDFEPFLTSPHCTTSDAMLIAQVTGLAILSRAFDYFGLEPKRTLASDDATLLNFMRFIEDLRMWRDKWSWLPVAQTINEPPRNIKIQYKFSELVLHSLVLRGRSLEKITELPVNLRPLALKAVEAAHTVLQHFLDYPRYRDGIVGLPLYLHSMIAYAAVFLMKMASRWHLIGITTDVDVTTVPLIEHIIMLLRDCKAGANHMVYSMATGFERMLKQLRHHRRSSLRIVQDAQQVPNGNDHTAVMGMNPYISDATNAVPSQTTMLIPTYDNASPYTAASQDLDLDMGWGFQDQDLWSVGMGYDLLEPGGQGLPSMEFPYHVSQW